MVVHIVDQALDRSGENVAQLEAVAAKRVLCTSEDFNALLYTAVNLHRMTSKESIEYFLGDETVYERLKELWEGGRHSAGSPNLLAGAFSRAFLQLVFTGESAKLLVEPHHRQRYSEALSPSGQDVRSLHPLKQNVKVLNRCIDMGLELLHTHCDDSIWLLYYCQILKVTLDEMDRGSGLFEGWLNHIIAKYPVTDGCKPHIICLVAWGVRMLNAGIVTPMKPLPRRVLNRKWEFDMVQLERLELEGLELEGLEKELEGLEGLEWRLRLGQELEPEPEQRPGLEPESGGTEVGLGMRSGLALALQPGLMVALQPGLRLRSRLRPVALGLRLRLGSLRQRGLQLQQRGLLQEMPGRGEIDQLRGEIDQLQGEIDQLRGEVDPEHFLQVQQQRVNAVKELVGSAGWEKPLFPERGLER